MALDPSIALGYRPPKFNTPFEVLGQINELRQQQQQMRGQQAQEEARRQDIEKQRREEADAQRFYQILSTSKDTNDATERIRTDVPSMYQGFLKQRADLDEKAATLAKTTAEAKRLEGEIAKQGQDYAAPYLQLVEQSGHDPGVFNLVVNHIASHFPDFPVDSLRQRAQGGPDAIRQIVQAFKSPQQQNADTTAQTAAAELPGRQATSAMQQQIAAGMRGGLTPEQQQQNALRAREVAATEMNARVNAQRAQQDESAVDLTPEALKLTAHQFAMTGQLPPMGMGKTGAAVRTKIINEAANIYKDLDLPSQVAAYNANKASLGKMQAQRDAVGAFEETALKNLDQFLGAAQKVVDLKSPWLNSPVRAITGQGLGSADQAAFNAARQAVIPEFAKLLGNPSLSGQLTDAQRKEVDTILSPAATLAQIYASAKILKADAANRKTALDDGIKAIQDRIARPPGQPATLTGRMRVKGPNGETGTVPEGTTLPAGWSRE